MITDEQILTAQRAALAVESALEMTTAHVSLRDILSKYDTRELVQELEYAIRTNTERMQQEILRVFDGRQYRDRECDYDVVFNREFFQLNFELDTDVAGLKKLFKKGKMSFDVLEKLHLGLVVRPSFYSVELRFA